MKESFASLIQSIYILDSKIGYVFIANLMASGLTFLLLLGEFKNFSFLVDKALHKKMLKYALPIMLVGLAGSVNELFDRVMLRRLLPYSDAENLRQLGLYGYSYKLAMLMTMFIQAFRFAAEPIFFKEAQKRKCAWNLCRCNQVFCNCRWSNFFNN